ncbi:MAG: hypothetical protein H6849_02550 [Alphaproteobacteria bacterium]|nr:MAG: hypothetical protein H6849_02550 [Alphaproteobacteria bacterium]
MHYILSILTILLCPPLLASFTEVSDAERSPVRTGIHMHPDAHTLKLLDLSYISADTGDTVNFKARRTTDHYPNEDEIHFAESCVTAAEKLLVGTFKRDMWGRTVCVGKRP